MGRKLSARSDGRKLDEGNFESITTEGENIKVKLRNETAGTSVVERFQTIIKKQHE